MKKSSTSSKTFRKIKKQTGKLAAFYKQRAALVWIAAIAVIIVIAVVLIASLARPQSKSSLTREQELMEMVRSKNVIRSYVPSINNFFVMYYNALATGDTSILEDSFDDPRKANISADISSVVNRISDVQVYITPGIKKDEVVAFVRYNIYFKNISLFAPAVDSFYIRMNTGDSSIRILTKMYTDKDINTYMTLESYREPLRSIIADTEADLYVALNNNPELRNLYVIMSSMTEGKE